MATLINDKPIEKKPYTNTVIKKEYKKWYICLNIPDQYEFMSPNLIELLKRKIHPVLGI